MKAGRSSQSAQMVALVRAAHALFDAPPVFDDRLALDLVDPEFRPHLDQFREPERQDPIARKGRAYIPFRQRTAEETLEAGYARGIRQYVILGAGLDSYAFRQPEGRADLRIFEVDHPATQARKRERLAELGWTLPENLVFTPCDFESTRLSDALERVGFESEKPSLFAWLGVVIYLTRETVRGSLAEIAELSAPGSELVFEFGLPTEDLAGEELVRRKISLAQSYRPDEPFEFFCRFEEIEALAREAGFESVEAIDHAAAESRLLAERSDEFTFRIGLRLAIARL